LHARSRWTRALELSRNENVKPEDLILVLSQNSGLFSSVAPVAPSGVFPAIKGFAKREACARTGAI